MRFKISNTFDQPKIEGLLHSQEISFGKFKFLNTNAQLTYADSLLFLTSLTTRLDGMNFNLIAQANFKRLSQQINLALEGKGRLFSSIIEMPFNELKNSRSNFSLQAEGNFKTITGAIRGTVQNYQAPDTTFIFAGGLSYQNRKFTLQLNSPSHAFNGKLEWDFLNHNNPQSIQLTGFHHLIQDFAEYQKFKKYFHFKNSKLAFEIRDKKISIVTEFDWNGNTDQIRTARLNGVLKTEGKVQKISGDLSILSGGKQFAGSFDLLKKPDLLQIKKMVIEDVLLGDGQIRLGASDSLRAKIVFPNTPMRHLAQLFFRDQQTVDQGRLLGMVNISGTLKKPELSGKFELADLIIHRIGNYDGSLAFDFSNDVFSLHELKILQNKENIFLTRGYYSIKNDSLNFDFLSEQIDLNSTLIALFNKPGLISGLGLVDLQLRGRRSNPIIRGEVSVLQGKLSQFAFDKMTMLLEGTNAATNSNKALITSSGPGMKIKQFTFVRNGQFSISGKGFFPFTNVGALDVELSGNGNILSILPELTNFFKETKSNGNWKFRLGGSASNILISEARIDLTDGYLKLGDVAPEIKDIALSAELEQDGFLKIKYLSGKIKRQAFVFQNFRQVSSVPEKRMVPFTIPDLGLNLGIFMLETSTSGISLHIPGLMAKKDFGNFNFLGKNSGEKFYFAGPWYRPYVRGTLLLQHMDFTFPFITGDKGDGEKQNDPVVEVLKSIDWDVLALTGKDTHYQRQVPSGLDNVYVDLILDTGVGGLQFNGVLAENSFGVTGTIESSRGNVEYLNLNFQVLKAGAEFDMETRTESDVDFDKSTLLPIIYGEARTTVTDSTGFPYYIYLTLLTIDQESGQAQKRGRLGEVMFQLSSENTRLGDTEGEILASLGYSTANIKEMATDLIGISADNLVFRPLFRPFERELEQRLGLDIVRFSSRFTRNLIEMNVSDERNFMIESKLFLLRSTKVMIGKYLADQIFLSYSGQLEAGLDYRYQHEGFGLSHKFGLEYRINPSLLLQMEYDYNSLLLWQRDDKKILLRHTFPF